MRERTHTMLVALLLIVLSFGGVAFAQTPKPRHGEWVKVVEVISGDVLIIEREGEREEIVLFAIETPPIEKPFGAEAAALTRERCLGKDVLMLDRGRDAHDRISAIIVYAGRNSINRELIAEGLARTLRPREGRNRHRFESLLTSQLVATASRKGMWGAGNPDTAAKESRRVETRSSPLRTGEVKRRRGRRDFEWADVIDAARRAVGAPSMQRGGDESASTDNASEPPSTFATAPDYEIAERRDFSRDEIIRYEIVVTVKRFLRLSQYTAIAERIVTTLIDTEKINALAVAFYLEDMDTTSDEAIANAFWAPNGVWIDAHRVPAGDYSSHEYFVQTRRY